MDSLIQKYHIEIVKADRKTTVLQIKPDGRVFLRAPLSVPDSRLEQFLRAKERWLKKKLESFAVIGKSLLPPFTPEQLAAMAKEASAVIAERVRHFAPLVGVGYRRIFIRSQKTRWGSCSAEGNLNFNCLLVLTPPEVLDTVVVHELCHRKRMDHSSRFRAEMARVLPDYAKWEKWLKEHGGELIRRLKK